MIQILENKNEKIIKSKNYNSVFFKETGAFFRWGKDKEDNPEYCFSPEILDLEISQGKCSMNCKHCYKQNGEDDNTKHMTLSQFQNIFHKVANTKFLGTVDNKIVYKNESALQQIAFGITDINANKDFFKMMQYCRAFGVVPNYTTNGMFITDEIAKETARLCGAVAVSVYENKDIAYNAIEKFTNAGMNQVNIHFMLSEETYDRLYEIFDDIKNDKRLSKLKAIVLLGYKPKGSGLGNFNILKFDKFKTIVNYALDNNIPIGFDSCSANKFLKAIKDRNNYKELEQCSDPCESSCFSSYINCEGKFFSCSFCEGEGMWKEGIDVLNCNDFIKDVWNNEKTLKFRENLIKNNRCCPMYKIDED